MAYRSVSVWLEDILSFINNINTYTASVASFEEYNADKMLIDAVERNFEKISESLKIILRSEPRLPISNANKNYWIQELDQPSVLRCRTKSGLDYYQKDLPKLKEEIIKILDDYERKLELNEL